MRSDSRSDRELILGVQNGARECFEGLYERYKVKMFNYLYFLLGNRQDAEDATHDLFIHVYRKASFYKPTAKFSSWLYKMARNLGMDMLRKQKTHRAVPLDETIGTGESTLADLLPAPGSGPGEAAESFEEVGLVREGLSMLEPQDREVICLCDIQGVSHGEASKILGCVPGTVTVKLFRARRRLAKILKDKGLA